jgi:hypothetical protein
MRGASRRRPAHSRRKIYLNCAEIANVRRLTTLHFGAIVNDCPAPLPRDNSFRLETMDVLQKAL